jgi:hypothetical protein
MGGGFKDHLKKKKKHSEEQPQTTKINSVKNAIEKMCDFEPTN